MFEFFYNFCGLNQKLFLFANNFTNDTSIAAQVLHFFSYPFGISKFAIYYIIAVIFFYYQLQNINNDIIRHDNFWRLYQKFTRVGIIYTCFGFIYAILKFSVNLPRPFCSLASQSFSTIINTQSHRCLSSFPSAHVGLVVLISHIFWPYTNKIGKFCLILLIFAVAISRISLAMHYPSDIIYSFFVIVAVIILGNKINDILRDNLLLRLGSIIARVIK
ncbi:MAG: phosphatase PAP2 family protein [Janthinobacterium lividum]